MKRWPLLLYLTVAYTRFYISGKSMNYPRVLQLQTQSYCNARCSFCPYPVTSRKLAQGTMKWGLIEKIAEELVSVRFLPMMLFELHNEPLLDKRIFDMVRFLKVKRPDIYCATVTNGQLLDNFSVSEIIQSRIDQIVVSLNAFSENAYKRLDNGLSYERVMNNITALVSDRTLKPRVTLSFVATAQNLDDIHRALAYWRKREVRTRVVAVTNRAGVLENYEDIGLHSRYYVGNLLSRAWARMLSRIGGVAGCTLPFHQMNILFNGECIVCCHDWNRATIVGNVGNQSIKEIWNSGVMGEIRSAILHKRYEQIASCANCSQAR